MYSNFRACGRKNDKLNKENNFMFKFRTVYPYGLNTLINNVNLMKAYNKYELFYNFNDKIDIKRRKREFRKFAQNINFIIPKIWLKHIEAKFCSSYNIINVRNEICKLKISTLKKIKNVLFLYFKVKDLFSDLINFKLL